MSIVVSDLDPTGWHAAKLAYPSITGEQEYALARAIRAYEAHKASQAGVGDLSMNPDLYDEGGNLKASAISRPPTDAVGYKEGDVLATASAVPEEIAEVVEWCRCKGLGTPPDSMPNRAADLLEGQAREIATLKGELKHCEEMYENAVTYPNDAES